MGNPNRWPFVAWQVKGELTSDEFRLLVAFMEGPGAYFRQRLEGTLINGGVGKMMRRFPKQAKDGKKQHTQEALYFSDESDTF